MDDADEHGQLVSLRVRLVKLIAPGMWRVREQQSQNADSDADEDEDEYADADADDEDDDEDVKGMRLMLSHYPLSINRGRGIRRGSVLDIYGCHVLPSSFASSHVTLVCCAYSHLTLHEFARQDSKALCPPPVPAEIGGSDKPPLAYLPFDAACWLYEVYHLMQANLSSAHFENSLWTRNVPYLPRLMFDVVSSLCLGTTWSNCRHSRTITC